MSYQSVNPYDGKTLKSFETITDAQLEHKIAAAATCYQAWRNKTYIERAKIVAKVGELMQAHADELARTMTLEMGKRISEALGEVAFSARILAYYASNAERFLAPLKLNPTHGEAHMESSPIGVVFCVEPWNFPYYQLARIAGPHLMAGNVLMVKHAGIVPQCAIAFEKLWIEAGAPAGLYTNLLISHEQADRVVDDPRIKGVALTGSVAAGKSVASGAGRNLKVSSMELGGSDAFIVLDDADLEPTVRWAVWGRMYNTGQTCCAAKRFIVADKVADKFLEKFQAALGALEGGGPLGRENHARSTVHRIGPARPVEAGRWRGRQGCKSGDGRQACRSPGIIHATHHPDRHQAGQPGFPGRVLRSGGAVLPGQGRGRGDRAGQRLRFRTRRLGVHQGHRAWQTRGQPGGYRHDVHQQHRLVGCRVAVRGIKDSGYGRELGDMGIQQFVNKKLVRTVSMAAPA